MKNIIVTGVSRGLGLEIVKSLLSVNEYCVFGISRTMTEELEELISNNGSRLRWKAYDLSNESDIRV